MIRRHLTVVAVTAAALLGSATAALAHASLQEELVPAGTEQTLTMRVPDERDAADTARVDIRVPTEFTVLDCEPPEGWTCTVDEASLDGTVVVYERGESGAGEVGHRFMVTTPTEVGTYVFPTIQTYDDGEEVGWIQTETGAERPAPTLEVGESSGEVVDASPAPTAHEDPATTEPDTRESPEAVETPTETTDTAAPDAADAAEPEDGVGGGAVLPILLIGGASVAAVAIALGLRSRRG
jgi:hypothetical protein